MQHAVHSRAIIISGIKAELLSSIELVSWIVNVSLNTIKTISLNRHLI